MDPWETKGERAALAFAFTFGKGFPTMPAGDGADDKQAQSRSLDLLRGPIADAVEAFKDTLHLGARNTDAVIVNPHDHAIDIWSRDIDDDFRLRTGILHRVFEQVGNRGAQFFGVAHDYDVRRRLLAESQCM